MWHETCRQLCVVVLAIVSGCWSLETIADKRVALVIGNSAYEYAGYLKNPRNDAKGLARALRRVKFEVVDGYDLNGDQMSRKFAEFEDRLVEADVGLFFYAGHGLQVGGENFLVPVDAEFTEETLTRPGFLAHQTVSLNSVVRALSHNAGLSLVFVDACRDNPLTASIAPDSEGRNIKIVSRDRPERGTNDLELGRGLAAMKVSKGQNLLIAYATQPGNVAVDGTGGNSPFSKALIEFVREPGLEVRQVLTEVRREVIAATGNAQIPWDQSSLTSNFYFRKRSALPAP